MFNCVLFLICIVYSANASTYSFPDDFQFGVASASYQVEGGWNASGKGVNIWDQLAHEHPDWFKEQANGDVACDSYNKYKEDVQIIKDLGVNFYRFSLSWARIMPYGATNVINPDGIRYYNDLINELLANGIEPMVTLYHWDLPQALQEIGGFLNEDISQYFEEYADVVFENFGDRVKKWITFNEPLEVCRSGYSYGSAAPAVFADGRGGYICGRTILLAHAKTYHLYDTKYRPTQNGQVGITLNAAWAEPKSEDPINIEAANRYLYMELGWWAHPIFSVDGNYPAVMSNRVDSISEAEGYSHSRLPPLSQEEIALIRGTSDFFGLNHYSSWIISNLEVPITDPTSHYKDIGILAEQDPNWGWSIFPWLRVVPWGLRKLLVYIKDMYNNPPVYITENGFVDTGGLDDQERVEYYRQYLNATLEAIHLDGCNVKAHTAWSIMDNLEWREGFTAKFGLYQVDFDDPARPRTAKASAAFYKEVVSSRTVPEA